MQELDRVYSSRFDALARQKKDSLWRVLCRYLQRYIREHDVVLDLAAGYCEFINHINCGVKYAVDVSADTQKYAHPDVTVYRAAAVSMPMVATHSMDVVFCSNFFEHLPSRDVLIETLAEIHRVLKVGGTLIVIQPNIKYAFREYWDFIDHYLPLSHLSMKEALTNTRFVVDVLVPRFLPFTTKSRLPQTDWLLTIYLALPVLYRLFGKQMLIVARALG